MSGYWRDHPTTLDECLKAAREILSRNPAIVAKGSVDAEAEQLTQAAFRLVAGQPISRADFYARLGDRLTVPVGERLVILATLRAEGRPLQHVTGYQQFLDHEYSVTPAVLIPRPETEILASEAIEALARGPEPELGLEVGLGSGVLSIELLSRFPGLRMMASELSSEAEQVARSNAERILGPRGPGALRLEIARASDPLDVWEPFGRPRLADFLISNPPYLLEGGAEVDADVRAHEPATALFAPVSDPLHFYRGIASRAREFLRPGAMLFLEIPHERADPIRAMFEPDWSVRVIADLAGRPRVIRGEALWTS
jgi:release factor glutamine methyltransferase